MSEGPSELRRIVWSEVLPLSMLFRGFQLAIDVNKIVLATALIASVYLGGRVLDAVWPGSGAAVVGADGVNEAQLFRINRMDRELALDWIHVVGERKSSQHVGVFRLLMSESRGALHELMTATAMLSPGGVIGAVVHMAAIKLWLLALHPVYAFVFVLLVALPAWAYFGAAIARMAAVQATRHEPVSIGAALAFAKKKFLGFYLVPLVPLAILLVVALFFRVGGWIGAIPLVGTILVPLLWCIAIVAGIGASLALIGIVLAYPLLYPTMAVESTDGWEAYSKGLSFVAGCPWRTAIYYTASLVYGAICYAFVKFVVRLGLFLVGAMVGAGMNIGSASTPTGNVEHKLDAMWKSPALDFSTPFFGQMADTHLSGASAAGKFLIACWTFGLVAVVGGFLVSFYLSASTLCYLLLRRDVDATDFEEVFTDEEMQEPSSASTPPAAESSTAAPASLASLPVVGADAAAPHGPEPGH
ncbi:MAG: hypothetical protein U1A27_14435 [Phycisphaerae bacterium]